MTDLAKIRREAREMARKAKRPYGQCLEALTKKHGFKKFEYVDHSDKKKGQP